MEREAKKLLHDILESCDYIKKFVGNLTFKDYVLNVLVKNGVERRFEIIGEALNRLHKSHPNIAAQITDFRNIIDFRNVLTHGYDVVSDRLVWQIIQENLPLLKSEVVALFDD